MQRAMVYIRTCLALLVIGVTLMVIYNISKPRSFRVIKIAMNEEELGERDEAMEEAEGAAIELDEQIEAWSKSNKSLRQPNDPQPTPMMSNDFSFSRSSTDSPSEQIPETIQATSTTANPTIDDPMVDSQELSFNELRRTMKQRRLALMNGCRTHNTSFTETDAPHNLQYSPRARAVYCSIPKIGCSFLKRVFYVVDVGTQNENPLEMSSTRIHSNLNLPIGDDISTAEQVNRFLKDKGILSFLFVRDPYAKVFSAYCDKVFLSSIPNINAKIMKWKYKDNEPSHAPNPLNISFSEALQYSAKEVGNKVDQHFLSASHSCDACHIHYDFIGKMESFNDDVSFILSRINRSHVFEAMGDVDLNNHIGIIHDLTDRTFREFGYAIKKDRSMSDNSPEYCLSKELRLRRLWKLWKIRGFIGDSHNFPWKKSKSICQLEMAEYSSESLIALRNSGDRASLKAQRQQYLLQAFRSVPLDVLQRYREAVRRDCDMFGYECSPEYIFKGRTEGDEERNLFSDISFTYID